MRIEFGPGDEETWGPCFGHPLDPRTEEDDFEDQWQLRMDRETIEWIHPLHPSVYLDGECWSIRRFGGRYADEATAIIEASNFIVG